MEVGPAVDVQVHYWTVWAAAAAAVEGAVKAQVCIADFLTESLGIADRTARCKTA